RLWQNTTSMDAKTFFRELRRRNVYKVAVTYAVVAWLLIEAVSILLSTFEGRTQLLTALMVIVALGFGLALFISWAFEATPQGMKRTANVPPDAVLPSWSRRKFGHKRGEFRMRRLKIIHGPFQFVQKSIGVFRFFLGANRFVGRSLD